MTQNDENDGWVRLEGMRENAGGVKHAHGGVYVRTIFNDPMAYVWIADRELPSFIAWLRKTYPEHFTQAQNAESVDTRSAFGVVPDVNAAREYANHMERAAAAMQRVRGER